MKHIIAILIKFIYVAIFTFSVLGIYNISLSSIFLISVVLTISAYLIGDLFIFRRFGHIPAVIANFVLYFVILSVILYLYIDKTNRSFMAAGFTTIFITTTDALFHPFVISRFFRTREDTRPIRNPRFSTEFSEEIDGRRPVDRKNKK